MFGFHCPFCSGNILWERSLFDRIIWSAFLCRCWASNGTFYIFLFYFTLRPVLTRIGFLPESESVFILFSDSLISDPPKLTRPYRKSETEIGNMKNDCELRLRTTEHNSITLTRTRTSSSNHTTHLSHNIASLETTCSIQKMQRNPRMKVAAAARPRCAISIDPSCFFELHSCQTKNEKDIHLKAMKYYEQNVANFVNVDADARSDEEVQFLQPKKRYSNLTANQLLKAKASGPTFSGKTVVDEGKGDSTFRSESNKTRLQQFPEDAWLHISIGVGN